MKDIVYILKEDVGSEELRYSLRSVCKNFPYRKIWFFCGKPKDIEPDEYVPFKQKGVMAWQKSTSTIREICKTEGVTDDFWLFNDDFFIMKKVVYMPVYYDGTLRQRIDAIEGKRGGLNSLYSQQLRLTREALMDAGYKTLNYAVHMPMLINKEKALETLDAFPKCCMFRSLYGNMHNVGGINHKDVKIVSNSSRPLEGCDFLSTVESAWHESNVGKFIRESFPNKCKYEKE